MKTINYIDDNEIFNEVLDEVLDEVEKMINILYFNYSSFDKVSKKSNFYLKDKDIINFFCLCKDNKFIVYNNTILMILNNNRNDILKIIDSFYDLLIDIINPRILSSVLLNKIEKCYSEQLDNEVLAEIVDDFFPKFRLAFNSIIVKMSNSLKDFTKKEILSFEKNYKFAPINNVSPVILSLKNTISYSLKKIEDDEFRDLIFEIQEVWIKALLSGAERETNFYNSFNSLLLYSSQIEIKNRLMFVDLDISIRIAYSEYKKDKKNKYLMIIKIVKYFVNSYYQRDEYNIVRSLCLAKYNRGSNEKKLMDRRTFEKYYQMKDE